MSHGMSPAYYAWTDERVTQAVELWRAGKSAREIAELIGNPSRNSVIGRLSRMGLTRSSSHESMALGKLNRRATVRETRPRAQARVFGETRVRPVLVFAGPGAEIKPGPKTKDGAFAPLPGSAPRDLMTRSNLECSWIVDSDGSEAILACCQPVTHGSWCAAHNTIGHLPPDPRKDKTANELMRSLRRYVAA